ncbi:DNA polymerase III subunit chi [Veronia pacifica]|uniref:DNA polymerase III subunit chi n=1 Tax=Veronia pacifica TaxID=1080227 RepID=A0A1C3EQE5_9GAMM|nr:DNA polymerase III subunit chi [Veronia pacifica]ODA35402.1 DNA polymerase III subunit chi [Veronia pacifica]
MARATFYLLSDDGVPSDQQMIELTCRFASDFCQQGQKVYIAAADKCQAEQIDEALWQREPDNFVPHNLVGEGPRAGALVEIGWPDVRHSGHRSVLINLAHDAATFAPSFAQVVDFVPCEESRKQQARERYKIYRMAGRQMQTLAVNESPNSN